MRRSLRGGVGEEDIERRRYGSGTYETTADIKVHDDRITRARGASGSAGVIRA